MSKPLPYCTGCCTIIIPQPDVIPCCQECIQGNEDIAKDYVRLVDGHPPRGPFGVRWESRIN